MVMVQAIESISPWVLEIQPVHEAIPLAPFTLDGDLFPTDQETARFVSESWIRFSQAKTLMYGTPPHVFHFDFSGVQSFSWDRFNDGFAFVFGNCLGKPTEAFSVFDNVSSWKELQQMMAQPLNFTTRSGTRVLIASQGIEEYELVGDPHKVVHHQNLLADLTQAGNWVRGIDFAASLGIPRSVLHEMREEGLCLQENYWGKSYFRSLLEADPF